MKRKFNFRKLFPLSWHRYKNGLDFNAFSFYIDLLIYVIPIFIFITVLITNDLTK